MIHTILAVFAMLVAHLGMPATLTRSLELSTIATDIASAAADVDERITLVNVCVHESRCHLDAVGDHGAARGPWQVHAHRVDAAKAFEFVRWSYAVCGVGDLALFAGCGRCGSCPEISASLLDPSLPRR